ncbi:MAG: hypothetical protein KAH32_02930 [Chlamydiia bacterium]|nr:hypothetical protein [Chlamydiia bacterium]
MPTISNDRVLVISVHNGWSGLEPVFGLMTNKIIPLKPQVNIGDSMMPFHQLYVGSLYLGDNAIYDQDGGLLFEANNTQVLQLLNDRVNIFKQLLPSSNEVINLGEAAKRFKTLFAKNGDFSGIVKGIDPVDDEDLATKKYVDENAGSGGIASLVEDTTPELGGDLALNEKYITLSDTCKIGHNSAFGMPLPFLATANIAEYGGANMPLIVVAEEMLCSVGTPNPESNFFGSHFIRHMDIGRRKREREYFFPNPGITFEQDQWYALRVNGGVLEAVTIADNRDTNVWANKLTDMFELTKPWELENIKFSPISFSDADANFNCTMISNTDGTDQYWDYYTQIAVQDHMNHSGVNGMEGILDSETQHGRIFVLVQFDRVCTFTGGRLTLTITEDITN